VYKLFNPSYYYTPCLLLQAGETCTSKALTLERI
jgi:hypothetical protein